MHSQMDILTINNNFCHGNSTSLGDQVFGHPTAYATYEAATRNVLGTLAIDNIQVKCQRDPENRFKRIRVVVLVRRRSKKEARPHFLFSLQHFAPYACGSRGQFMGEGMGAPTPLGAHSAQPLIFRAPGEGTEPWPAHPIKVHCPGYAPPTTCCRRCHRLQTQKMHLLLADQATKYLLQTGYESIIALVQRNLSPYDQDWQPCPLYYLNRAFDNVGRTLLGSHSFGTA